MLTKTEMEFLDEVAFSIVINAVFEEISEGEIVRIAAGVGIRKKTRLVEIVRCLKRRIDHFGQVLGVEK